MPDKKSPTHHARRTTMSLGARCLLLFVLLLSVGIFASRMVTFHQLNREKEELLKEKEEYEQQIERAEYYLNGSINYEDIVRIAKEKFNLAFPDEIIYYSEQVPQS